MTDKLYLKSTDTIIVGEAYMQGMRAVTAMMRRVAERTEREVDKDAAAILFTVINATDRKIEQFAKDHNLP